MTKEDRGPKTTPALKTNPPTSEAELARQRKRYDDEMEAFQQMMNYNADVAYGIEHNKE